MSQSNAAEAAAAVALANEMFGGGDASNGSVASSMGASTGQPPLAKIAPPPLIVPTQSATIGLQSAPAYQFYFSYPTQFGGGDANGCSAAAAAAAYGSHSAGPYGAQPQQQQMAFFDAAQQQQQQPVVTSNELFRF